MIHRVVDLVRDRSAVGIKTSLRRILLSGALPASSGDAGVLIVESMAQTAAVLVVKTLGPESAGKVVYFMSIEGAKFRRPVVPGISHASTW